MRRCMAPVFSEFFIFVKKKKRPTIQGSINLIHTVTSSIQQTRLSDKVNLNAYSGLRLKIALKIIRDEKN